MARNATVDAHKDGTRTCPNDLLGGLVMEILLSLL